MPNKLKFLLYRLLKSLLAIYDRIRFKLAPGWRQAKVDDSKEHIKIYYGNDSVLALICPDEHKDQLIVEFKQAGDDAKLKKIIEDQRRLINNLLNRDMPLDSRWQYAIYHCGTTSNAYSKINTDVYWSYYGA